MAQFFSIVTYANYNPGGPQSPYGLNAASPAEGQTLTIWYLRAAFAGSLPAVNSQGWQLTTDGHIINPANPNLVAAIGPDNQSGNPTVVLATLQSGDKNQLWSMQSAGVAGNAAIGVIVNQGNNQALTVDSSSIYSGAAVWTQAMPQGAAPQTMQWQIEPCGPAVNQWTAIQAVQDTNLVVNISGASMAPGANVILWPTAAGANNAMWMISPEGFVCSGLNPDIVLSLGPNNTVVTYPKQSINFAFQQWAAVVVDEKAGTIQLINQANSQALAVSGSIAQDAALVTAASDSSSPTQQWRFATRYPVDIIMAQPAIPFPPAQDAGQITAYNYISAHVSPACKSIRAQYSNLAVNISSYQSDINGMTYREAGVSEADWKAVSGQINKELSYAGTIRTLYGLYTGLISQMQATEVLQVTIIAGNIEVSTSAQVKAVTNAVAEGMLYTVLSACPGAGPVLANLMQTGYNAVQAYNQNKANTFVGTVANLQQSILNLFTSVGDQMTAQQEIVLNDWGKMQAIADLTTLSSGDPGSLNWQANTTDELVSAATPGYQLAIVQVLMPAAYELNWWIQQVQNQIGDLSAWASWWEVLPCGVSNQYAVYKGGSLATETIMNTYVWGNGVSQQNFYQGLAGWSAMPVKYKGLWNQDPGTLCNGLLTTVVNQTGNTFTIDVTPNHADFLSWGKTTSAPLPPYGTLSLALFANHHQVTDGISGNIYVKDASNDTQYIEFEVQQDYCMMKAGNLTCNVWSATSYTLSPNQNSGGGNGNWGDRTAGSWSGNDWGTIVVGIVPS